jgi:hypothetical protein
MWVEWTNMLGASWNGIGKKENHSASFATEFCRRIQFAQRGCSANDTSGCRTHFTVMQGGRRNADQSAEAIPIWDRKVATHDEMVKTGNSKSSEGTVEGHESSFIRTFEKHVQDNAILRCNGITRIVFKTNEKMGWQSRIRIHG